MALQVELAGTFRLGRDGWWIHDDQLTRHARLALAYFVLERGRRITRDELADLLWEERVPPSWKPALRGVVGRVRAALAGCRLTEVLLTGAGWYELVLPSGTTVDVESAAEAVLTAARLLGDGRTDQARETATYALAVAGQPFLPGVHAEWVEQRQELLEGIRLRALDVVADAALTAQDWPAAQQAAAQAVALAPLRESAYRRLALAHSGAGDRGEALRVLASCRAVLAEEVGVDTSPELEGLVATLQGGLPSRATARSGVDPVPPPAPPPLVAARSGPFINRTAQLATLLAVWDRALTGVPQAVVVAGEVGVGKTRLIAEFCATLAGTPILYGRADEAGHPGSEAVLEALRPHLSTASVATAAGMAETTRTTLANLAAGGPVVLVIDDVQWVGPAGLALLRAAVRDPLRLLIVAAFRTGEPEASARLASLSIRLRRDCEVTRIDLAGLTAGGVAELVRASAGDDGGPEFVAAIADATAGNPFFVRELLRLMAEPGTAVPGGSGGALPTAVAVPANVRDVILARCDRLPAAARRTLAAAAVCGREFALATLELLPDLSRVDVLAAVEAAIGSHLVLEHPARAGHFTFVHGLVQETLYQQLSSARRQRLHADVATVLEGPHGASLATAARLAYHLLRSGPAAAERATIAASRAGADALRRHAYHDAARDFAAALEVAGDDPSLRCRLRLELAGARWRAGDTTSARAQFETAAAEAAKAGRSDLVVRAVFGALGHGPTLGRCDQRAVALVAGALDQMRVGDPFRPRLQVRMAMELAGVADPRAADLCGDARQLAEALGDPSTVAYVLNADSWVSLHAVDAAGLLRADRIIALSESVGDRHMLLEGRLWRCTSLLRLGDQASVEVEIAALEQIAVDLRQPFYLRLPLRLRACLALVRGELRWAQRYAAEAYTVERRVHPDDAEAHALLHAVALSHASRDWAPLRRRLVDAVGAEPAAPHWHACRAVQLAYTGQVAPATRILRPLLAGDAAVLRANPLGSFALALIAQAIDDHDRLRRSIDRDAVDRALRPWQGTHVVAGCGVASLGPAEAYLTG